MNDDDSIEVYEGGADGIIDFIRGSMQEKTNRAHAPIAERAGKPYIPSSGTEGVEFEESWCGRCRHYRGDDDALDCEKGHLTAAWITADVNDPSYPKAWVYDASGRPTCSDWIQRASAPDGKRETFCGGAKTPEDERIAYERAMRGEVKHAG